ncbi:MAG: STAS domain-containing protein, partial [Eubacterium sp.]|nr:STAS domain-containing protein [Eubacterium sp.]
MKTEYNDGKLVISLEGRIDTNNASETEKSLFEAVEGHSDEEVILDASGLEYISSAGLRALMKLRKSYGKAITITEVSPEVYEIFDTTGFVELFDVKKRLRQISVDGCEIIGVGGNGKVYKKDDETIVKVYYGERNDLEKIRRNQQVTKSVFVQGIP